MKPSLTFVAAFVVLTLAVPLAGCGGPSAATRQRLQAKVPPAPKRPPKAPPRKDVPLDPALASAARAELTAAARSGDATLRANALEALRGTPDEVSRRSILKGLEDEEPLVRFSAAMAAGELKLPDARQPLLGMVEDPDKHVRIGVRFALHKLGITDYSHDLEDAARDEDPGVRGNTALALGLLGEKSAIRSPGSILRVLRRDPHPAVRQQASESMWRLGDAEAREDLLALTVSTYVDDQMVGFLALAAPRDPEVRKYVSVGLTSDSRDVSLVAARAMGMLGSDEGYAIALRGAKSGNAVHRFLAALALGAIGRTDAQPALRGLLRDKDARVRVAAAAAVLQLAPGEARVAGARAGG